MKLANFEVAWAKASFGTIFPGSDEAGMQPIDAMDLGPFLSEVTSRVPFQAAMGLRIAIWLAALAPLFVMGRLATIASLPRPDREKVLTTLLASKTYAIRSLVLILKTIGALLFCADANVRARMYARAQTAKSGERLVALRLKGQAA